MESMKKLALTAALACTGFGAQAQTAIGCPGNSVAATVDVEVTLNTVLNCPLLQEAAPRRLVDKFAAGAIFAYPAPGTCMTGSNLTGTITPTGGIPVAVTGQTWSAQTVLPEALALGGNPLFITDSGGRFMSGGAITVASLRSLSGLMRLDMVFSDRFTLDFSGLANGLPVIDTEDFQIIGSAGTVNATGRLQGEAAVAGQVIANTPMHITGRICLK